MKGLPGSAPREASTAYTSGNISFYRSPFVSFDIVSYAAGLTGMGFWGFFWATGLGQLPATIVYSHVGDMLVGSARTFVFGLLILFALSVLIFMGRQIWQDRQPAAKTEQEGW